MVAAVLTPPAVAEFCETRTPQAWVDEACARIPELLLDHANCELKAASTAIGFLYRYPERSMLAERMSRLAREELRHYEQVKKLMREREIPFARLDASRYAATMREAARAGEPHRLMDTLIIGALIEARSCERFAALVPQLPQDLATFYKGLLISEARHFEQYLHFAKSDTGASDEEIAKRVVELKSIEAALITDPDSQFRFHSGPPACGGSSHRSG
jgi:tRNA 2-(methylsulfanyl)-N6-isopentenyladenosine37 hydroxylase